MIRPYIYILYIHIAIALCICIKLLHSAIVIRIYIAIKAWWIRVDELGISRRHELASVLLLVLHWREIKYANLVTFDHLKNIQ
jgi:hypothetical protein